MALTEPSVARVLRDTPVGVDRHAFAPVAELPRVTATRPRPTGNGPLDAIRDTAWNDGYADGHSRGTEDGYQAGLERGIEQGRAIGYDAGLASAQADAVVAVRAEMSAALDALAHAGRQLAQRDAVTLAELESVVVDLALQLTESILEREVATAAEPGRDALVRALRLAPDEEELVAHLHPDDLTSLGDVADLAPGRSIRLVPDASVGRGGCHVEAGAARLDARIETALRRVREALAR